MKSIIPMQIADGSSGEAQDSFDSVQGLFRSSQAVDYPELREQMLRLAVGMSVFEYQVEAALRSSKEQVRETERALWRATLKKRRRI